MANPTLIDQLKAVFANLTKKKGAEATPKKEKPKKVKPKKIKITPLYVWDADNERAAGNAADALKILNMGMEKYPGADNLDTVLSAVYFDLEDYTAAMTHCEAALAKSPDSVALIRRKGAIFEKLGDTVERNRCFRLVHDMDPLDAFWKEEYADVPPVEVPAVAVPENLVMPEDLTMPDLELPAEDSAASSVAGDETLATAFAGLDALQDDAAPDASSEVNMESSLDEALAAATPEVDVPASIDDEAMSGNDVSSAIEDFFGDEEEVVEEKKAAPSPFAALNVPTSIEDEPTADSGLFEKSATAPVVEDKPTNVDDAFGDLFGEDELPEENASAGAFEKSAETVPAVEDKPTNVDDAFGDLFGEDELPEENASAGAFEKSAETAPVAEDKPTNIDDAFGDLLGEDELPEENASAGAFEKSAETVPAAEDKPTNVDDAFGDLFGEDELPEENASAGAFEKSAETMAVEEPAKTEEISEEDFDFSVPGPAMELEDDAPAESLASLLGNVEIEDKASLDLDANKPTESLSDILGKLDAAVVSDEPAAGVETPNELGDGVGDAIGAMFGDDEFPEEAPAETAPVEAAPVAEPVVEETAQTEVASELDNAFGDLLGDDELPEETAVVEPAAAPLSEVPEDTEESLDFSFDKSVDVDAAPVETPVAESTVAEEPAATEISDELDNAFGDLLGDDELPEETAVVEPAAAPLSEVPEDTEENLDFSFDKSIETVEAPAVAEAPASEEPLNEVKDDVDDAFASLFGKDDEDESLEMPSLSPAAEKVNEAFKLVDDEPEKQEAPASLSEEVDSSFDALFGDDDDELTLPPATAAMPAVDADETLLPPLSSDAAMPEARTGAFEALFNMDDELPEEKTAPQDSVDFLMSGDSDDEVSSALLKDPKESLMDSAESIDDSLNTRTLAEIYFEQGLYQKSLDIYMDLAEKNPENESIAARLAEIKKAYDEKFGG